MAGSTRCCCLGTGVVRLGKPAAPSSSSSEEDGPRALLLVEQAEDEDHGSLLLLHLSTGSSSYSCRIAPSYVSLHKESLGQKSHDKSLSENMAALGRFLLGDTPPETDGDGTSTQGTHTSRSQGSGSGSEDAAQQAPFFANWVLVVTPKTPDETTTGDLVLALQERLASGMTRTIHRQTLKPKEDSLAYGKALGAALNEALGQTKTLAAGRDAWKQTAEDLGRAEQTTKDVLLANFCHHRNAMVEKHRRELEALKEAHAQEKATGAKKPPPTRKVKKEDPADTIRDEADLPDLDDARALAEGRKLAGRGPRSQPRKAILPAEDALDMVRIQNEGLAFAKQQQEERERRKRARQQAARAAARHEAGSEEDEGTIRGSQRGSASRAKSNPKGLPSRNNTAGETESPPRRKKRKAPASPAAAAAAAAGSSGSETEADEDFRITPRKRPHTSSGGSISTMTPPSAWSQRQTGTTTNENEEDDDDDGDFAMPPRALARRAGTNAVASRRPPRAQEEDDEKSTSSSDSGWVLGRR